MANADCGGKPRKHRSITSDDTILFDEEIAVAKHPKAYQVLLDFCVNNHDLA